MSNARTIGLLAVILAAALSLSLWFAARDDAPRGLAAKAPAAAPQAAQTLPEVRASVRATVASAKVRPADRKELRARVRAASAPADRPALPAEVPAPREHPRWSRKAKQSEAGTSDAALALNPIPSAPGTAALASADTGAKSVGGKVGSRGAFSIVAPDTLVGDEFNGPALDTSIWAFVNPLGDGTLSMTGTQAQISLPANVRHDLWTNTDEVPRLMQPAPNTNFEVEGKWDTGVTTGYQLQGFLVQQDADDMLRVEVHHNGGGAKLFVARIAGGAASVHVFNDLAGGAPVYLRLKREGTTWSVRTSSNGTSWSTAATFTDNLTVAGMGPFAGNSGAEPPAFASRIDHFRVISAVAPDSNPPVVSNVTASASGIGAVVRWQTNEAATSSVAYGATTAYGGLVGRSAFVTSHSVVVTGLACGTQYQFQVRSRDASNNEGTSPNASFTTAACPTVIGSDEFDSTTLNSSLWTPVDPMGDTGLTLTGTHAELSMPAGVRHDLWTGTDEIPRLMQAAPNTNFEVEARWSSTVTTGFQLQGFLVQQDANDMLRIETHHDGEATRLFVARVANGVATTQHFSTLPGAAPAFMRLKRQGTTWTLRLSTDGDSWTNGATFSDNLAVTAIGPFAGNSGNNPPAFTSRIDYFRDVPPDLTPPTFSAITAQLTGPAATVTWTTNEPATSEIRYGRTTSYESGTVNRADFRRNHTLQLPGLACATTYHYQLRGTDVAGNTGSGTDRTFTTAACPEHLQTDEFNGSTLDTSKWAFVDPLGDSTLTLSGGRARIATPAGVRHDLWTGVNEVPRLLQAAPDEDFEVEAKFDSVVNTAYQMQGFLVQQDADDLLRIETHFDGANSFLFVASITGGTAQTVEARQMTSAPNFYLRLSRVGDRWTIRHSTDGEGWQVATSFVRAMDVAAVGPFAGNSGNNPPAFTSQIDYFREITDRTPPVISDITVTPRANSALVSWTTDEPASTVVAHGTTTAYGQTASDAKLVTRHLIRVTGLSCNTTYQLQLRSTDALNNTASSTNRTVATSNCIPGGGPDIDVWGGNELTFGAVGIPQRWVNVVGNVYDPQGVATLRATLNGRFEQGLTVGPDANRLERPGDFNLELNRDLLLPGPNTVEIRATDTAGNVSTRSVTVQWRAFAGGSTPPANGPVLVVVAHGDDAFLGMSGIIRQAKLAGRRVYVAATTNGDEPQSGNLSGYCGAEAGDPSTTAERGLTLSKETIEAANLLGLQHSTNLSQTEVIFLGYPNHSLEQIVELNGAPWTGIGTRLGRTYGEDGDASTATCNGDLRYLLNGVHSPLTKTALAADFDALLQTTQPSDIYTLVDFDGHPDHAEVARQTAASVQRLGLVTTIHGTVVHPHDSGPCMGFSAAFWPNPARVDDDPLSRFTPNLEFTVPPTPTCGMPLSSSWGPLGAPTESVEVPGEMQVLNPQQNLKYRAVNVWDSQCPPDDPAHVTCGYFNAFAKKNEFFWTQDYRGRNSWPAPYTADWTSTASIPQRSQVVEGQWTYDAAVDGVRPLSTGFDRLLTLGQYDWRSYEVRVPVRIQWLDPTKASAGIGIGIGWQGHTSWSGLQPRYGHPYGGICGFGRSFGENALPRLEITRNNAEVEDAVAVGEASPRGLTLGAEYMMKFRRVDLGNGSSRYSCKFWKTTSAEPAAWDLTVDQPDALNTNDKFRGSAFLMAHNSDAVFGDAQITPLG